MKNENYSGDADLKEHLRGEPCSLGHITLLLHHATHPHRPCQQTLAYGAGTGNSRLISIGAGPTSYTGHSDARRVPLRP